MKPPKRIYVVEEWVGGQWVAFHQDYEFWTHKDTAKEEAKIMDFTPKSGKFRVATFVRQEPAK